MAKFALYSDLHYELGGDFEPPKSLRGKVDAVILAGDIACGPATMLHARKISRALDAPAILVAGNHEYYEHVMEPLIEKFQDESDDEVRFLEKDGISISGVRFLGTTLWTDYALFPNVRDTMHQIRKNMNDYRFIKRLSSTVGRRKINPYWMLPKHREARDWLDRELGEPFDGSTVVVTHHAPSLQSVPLVHRSNCLSSAYASDLDGFIRSHSVDAWAHGHIHESRDYRIGSTRIVSNPYGYESEEKNESFRDDFVLEI
ncbi:metallophosphoesterase [Tepidicaulis sp. LMO-SS28]|uniref:metallophosphoesterase n=1 Tax=Tepidicaulis sp. LMO-SS28 TaxID=3447455 RepID=UPI003EE26717